METQFEMLLPNPRKRRQTVGVVVGGYGVCGVAWGAWVVALQHRFGASSGTRDLLFGLTIALLASLPGLPWFVRRLSYEPHKLLVEEERLRVLNQRWGTEQQFLFANIARYRILLGKGGAALWFQYQDGSRHVLSSNDSSLLKVAPALSQAIRRYEQQHGQPPKYRAESFFGNPVSTWFLAFFSLAVLAISWHTGVVLPPAPGFFGLFFSYFLFLLFCAAWYGNREQRRKY